MTWMLSHMLSGWMEATSWTSSTNKPVSRLIRQRLPTLRLLGRHLTQRPLLWLNLPQFLSKLRPLVARPSNRSRTHVCPTWSSTTKTFPSWLMPNWCTPKAKPYPQASPLTSSWNTPTNWSQLGMLQLSPGSMMAHTPSWCSTMNERHGQSLFIWLLFIPSNHWYLHILSFNYLLTFCLSYFCIFTLLVNVFWLLNKICSFLLFYENNTLFKFK